MSDIHRGVDAFHEAIDTVEPELKKGNNKLVLLGDYVHGHNSDRITWKS